MPFYSVENPYPTILSQIGGGLNGGFVYIGLPDQDPETFPQATYWDAAGTDPVAQPIDTIGGYISRMGSPAEIFTEAEYSIRIRDRFGAEIFYCARVRGPLGAFIRDLADEGGAGLVGFSPDEEYPANTAGAWLSWLSENNDIRFYGYVGDGSSHPLSSVTRFKGVNVSAWTLSQWQSAVPQVTSLSNQIDRVAVQAWFNDRPKGGMLLLPAGTGVFDAGIQTGRDQVFHLKGLSRDLSRIRFTGAGWAFMHGWDADKAANGFFGVEDLRIMPNAGGASAGCFRVRFSGLQLPYCHKIWNVLVEPENDFDSYFTNVTETWNIKRGADWRNFVWFGRFFHILGSSAHVFPPNIGPDCPPGQEGTDSGDSWNFDNCMGVGYDADFELLWTGFTEALHCHEQFRWVNCQSYSGNSAIIALDTNTGYAPADNFIIDTYGWQGSGVGFDFAHCEHIQAFGGLLVVDDTAADNETRLFNLIDCTDTTIERNEIFTEGTVVGGNLFGIAGTKTANIDIINNKIVHYATGYAEWLYVNANVPALQVVERANKFRGSGGFSVAKVNDQSGGAVSETRVADLVAPIGGLSKSWDVTSGLDTKFINVYNGDTDASGVFTITLPAGLFRSIKSVQPFSGSPSVNSPIAVVSSTTTTVTLDFTALSAITAVVVGIEVTGR